TWLLIALCLFASFLLSGMEAGVFALSRLRVRRLARAGKPSAKLLLGFLEKPENFLWTILVGNTLANFLILGWTLLKLHELLWGHQVWLAVAFVAAVFLFYALFDLLPKMFFRAHPNQYCLGVAPVFRLVHLVLTPLVLAAEGISKAMLGLTGGRAFTGRLFGSREEMRSVMQESAQGFTSDERVMINRVLDLQKFTVRQIATPLAQVVMVETHTPVSEAFQLARERRLWRFPVCETRDGRRRTAGLLALGPLLFRDDLDLRKPAATHMTPALFVDETVRLEVALRLMQRSRHRLAIVLARDGAEMGVVSLEDILKVMFGEVKL
ncbi:MAG TPA: CNNM domain-containing protein, partial [Verrucomicrobiae bacterium]|nr:CNNM domain-containing protein [Verrucomicrobiae bacterium]